MDVTADGSDAIASSSTASPTTSGVSTSSTFVQPSVPRNQTYRWRNRHIPNQNKNYSIDEAMVPYYGRHSCKQFIRGKPIRWGYKLWVGATRLGYVLWFDPYQGKSSTIAEGYKQFGLGGSVILECADVLQGRHPTLPFHLFFDNYFSSIPLLHELGNRGLRATGTVRENRTSKCPLEANKDFKKTERGSFVYKSSSPNSILVCKWNDNSVVTVASNTGTVEPLHKVKRFSQELKRFVHIEQPSVIRQYNENMGGVDRSDQNIGLYRTSIRGKKWYFSLFYGGEYDHLAFRRSLAKGLLESYKRSDKRGPCPTGRSHRESSRYDGADHLVQYSAPQLRCKVCKVKSFFICQKCKVHLHPKNCFIEFHTQ
ncbi:hypothetical protein ABMA27_003387 [Loxostege sticticalis]|uniref:PiggyBac transposable element-derived protein domain-containing protein n=1 Tax=Loxostege sticticalis TaxID=481309 RepID=A0ABR3HSY3_LOXSC